jgi:hypothetical protein
MRRFYVVALLCVLAILAESAGAARPPSATFSVSLQATVTKDWNTAVESIEDGCTVVRSSIGHQTVTLRSSRPTTVIVTRRSGKVSFSPSAVGFMTAKVTRSGEERTRKERPCRPDVEHQRCRPVTRRVLRAPLRFFRSARNEISFRPATLPQSASSCPTESAAVQGFNPALRDAQGKMAEVALARGVPQTAIARSDTTTELEGPETGRVVERVRWTLKFARR